jgi:acyl-CoA thioester hydrolase
MYAKSFVAGWGDMDFNSHMRNTAFLDRAADVRMMFFAENGFPMREFVARRLGPVVRKDEIEYFRELALLQEFSVTLAMAGLAADGSRFVLRNDVLDADGKLCARVTTTGGWLDLGARRLVAPPAGLLAVLGSLPRCEDFRELPSSLK